MARDAPPTEFAAFLESNLQGLGSEVALQQPDDINLWMNTEFSFVNYPPQDGHESSSSLPGSSTNSSFFDTRSPTPQSNAIPLHGVSDAGSLQHRARPLPNPLDEVKFELSSIIPQAAARQAPGGAANTKKRKNTGSQEPSPTLGRVAAPIAPAGLEAIGNNHFDEGSDDDETPDDKRKRNSAASARFRMKKKLKEQQLEVLANDMTARADSLQRKVQSLEAEVAYLKDLLTTRRRRESEEAAVLGL